MQKVDVAFRVFGTRIPADHGYLLYGAITQYLPELHAPVGNHGYAGGRNGLWTDVGIQQINAKPVAARQLEIQENSRLRIRIGRDHVDRLLPLVGKDLSLDRTVIRVGAAQLHPLVPAVRLRSWLVTIQGFVDPEPFIDAANRQLRSMNIVASAGIPWRRGLEGHSVTGCQKSPLVRRTIRIAGRDIVGYAVEVNGLTAEESIALQETGLGGRRRFGCGIFIPAV